MQHQAAIQPTQQQPATALVYLRIWQITGDKKRGIAPLLPIGRSTFLAKVKSGDYPQPVKLSERCTAWRQDKIFELLESFTKDGK